MGRLIDETEAMRDIDAIRPVDPQKNDYTHGIDVGLAMAKVAIKEQPTTQQLIPCSVRPPAENGYYLGQTDLGGFMVISYWNGLWNASEYGAEFAFEDGKIVAWMPLPYPWKGEQE